MRWLQAPARISPAAAMVVVCRHTAIAQLARRPVVLVLGGKVLCQAGRAEQLAYGTIFTEGLDMGHINVSAFYSALLRRGLGRTSPFVHQLTPTDVETHYKMVCFVRYV